MERVKDVVQVKPDSWQDGFCVQEHKRHWGTRHGRLFIYLFIFYIFVGDEEKFKGKKKHILDRWMMRKKSEQKQRRPVSACLLSSSCTRKKVKRVKANLRSVSITLLYDSPVGGDQCSWRRAPPVQAMGTSLGSDFIGEGDVFKVCAKILVRLLLEH